MAVNPDGSMCAAQQFNLPNHSLASCLAVRPANHVTASFASRNDTAGVSELCKQGPAFDFA